MNKNTTSSLLLLSIALLMFSPLGFSQGDANNGMKLFSKCDFCHTLGKGAKHHIGPTLNNIIGAAVGRQSNYNYSNAFKKAAAKDLIWDAQTIDAFLISPKKFIPSNKMNSIGIKNAQERADLIAYLATFSGEDANQKASVGFIIADNILAIKGDAEYGEYLSTECTTCHQTSGRNDGIPNIIGWNVNNFITAMHAYKAKHRENPVMQMVAGRLSDEEIAALAEYFKNLK